MRTLFKLVIFVVIIVVAALAVLLFIVDPNEYKQEISSQVEKVTGRKLMLEGDIGLSVFPWVALKLGPLSLSNAEGFEADSFARVDAAEVRIKLVPLLKKQLVMDTVVLDGLALNLERNKAGKTNWDDLAADDQEIESSQKPGDNSTGSGTPALTDISIAGIKLTNANILWSDASTSESYRLENLNLGTEPLVPGQPVAIDADFKLVSINPQAETHFKLNTRAMIDLDSQQYSLTGLNLSAQAKGAELAFSKAVIGFTGDIHADMSKQLVSIPDFSLTANAHKDQQVLDASLSAQFSTNLATQQTTLKTVELSAEVTDPALPDGKAVLRLTTDVSIDLQQQKMTLSALVVKIHDLLIHGDLEASKLLSENPELNGHVGIQPFNLRQLAKQLAIELPPMADVNTLEIAQADAEFNGSAKGLNIRQLNIVLDDSKLSGRLAVKDFDKPSIDFKLVLDAIDVDRYLPPQSKQEPAPSQSTQEPAPPQPLKTATATDDSLLPLDTLKQINTRGILDIGKLTANGIHSEKIHLEISAASGLIKLHPLSANLYQGQYQGNISLDARGRSMKFSIHQNLKKVQVGALLKDLAGDDMISGTANTAVKLRGNGNTVEQIRKTLAGNGQFAFTDGAVKGINIADSIRRAEAALKGKTLPPSSAPLETDFSTLKGSFTADKGVIVNKDLLAKSPLLRINGAGRIELPTEEIDYSLKVTVVGTYKGQGGADLSELQGLTIPLKITGNFDNPKPTVDLANLVREQASQEVKNKVADKLKDELGDDLGGIIGHALGTGSTTAAPAPGNASQSDKQQKPAEAPEKQLEDALKEKFKGLF